MQRSIFLTAVLLGSIFLLAGAAQATSFDDGGQGDVRHERTFGHTFKKGHGNHGWLRTSFSNFGWHDGQRPERGHDGRRWFERDGDNGHDHPKKRWHRRSGSSISSVRPDDHQQPVPEPSAALVFAAGLIVIARANRRR